MCVCGGVGGVGNSDSVLLGKPTERDHLEDPDVDGRNNDTELKELRWKGV